MSLQTHLLEVATSWVLEKEFASQTIEYGFDNILTQQLHDIGTTSCLGHDVKEQGLLICHEYVKHGHAGHARAFLC